MRSREHILVMTWQLHDAPQVCVRHSIVTRPNAFASEHMDYTGELPGADYEIYEMWVQSGALAKTLS